MAKNAYHAAGDGLSMRIAGIGHLAFAATMIGLGIYGLIRRDFTPVWQPVPDGVRGRGVLILACALVSLAGGLGLLWHRTSALAARILFLSLALWLLVFRAPEVVHSPMVVGAWFGVTETAVMVAAAWVLYVWFADEWEQRRLGFIAGDTGLRIARILYGLALVHFGLAHFVYLNQTTVLIPAWLPGHVGWAYFTGAAYILAGVSVLVGACARLSAALVAVQMAGFTLLVWVPIMAAGSKDPFNLSETILSAALTGAAWVVADSYRNAHWFGLNQR